MNNSFIPKICETCRFSRAHTTMIAMDPDEWKHEYWCHYESVKLGKVAGSHKVELPLMGCPRWEAEG